MARPTNIRLIEITKCTNVKNRRTNARKKRTIVRAHISQAQSCPLVSS